MIKKLSDYLAVSLVKNQDGEHELEGFSAFEVWALDHFPEWKSVYHYVSSRHVMYADRFKYLSFMMTKAYCDQSERVQGLIENKAPVITIDAHHNREKRIQDVALQLVARSSANVAYAFKLAEEYVCECERRDNTRP